MTHAYGGADETDNMVFRRSGGSGITLSPVSKDFGHFSRAALVLCFPLHSVQSNSRPFILQVCCCCWYLMLMLLLVVPSTLCTNYEKQSLQISYDKEDGLPTFGTLNGTVTELDTIAPNIALNKTDARCFTYYAVDLGQPS